MNNNQNTPELREVAGAMILAVNRPLGLKEIQKCLAEVAGEDATTAAFAKTAEKDIERAIDELAREMDTSACGMEIRKVAGGYKIQTKANCGKWLRYLVGAGRRQRLSLPALETLSVIAYRQPVSRAEIEEVRGVNVDHVIKTLMEMQLIRIAGRSELPGRPFIYGTTQAFLEHFGLTDLSELKNMHPSLAERIREEPPPAPTPSGEERETEEENGNIAEDSPEPRKDGERKDASDSAGNDES
ncbi:MAG: SMC-Scp complex subunit ScpB [Kiritimatiellia bacterium]